VIFKHHDIYSEIEPPLNHHQALEPGRCTSLHFSPDLTDRAPQIGFHEGFSEGVEYRAYGPLKNILCGIKDQAGSVTSGE